MDTKMLSKLVAAGAVGLSFATVPAGVTVTPEIVEALWNEYERVGRKLTTTESMRVIYFILKKEIDDQLAQMSGE